MPVNRILDEAPRPTDLWRHLDSEGVAAITVPHHMSVAMFPLSLEQFHHPGYDRAAEIYSCWGGSLEHHRPVSTYAERVPELAFIHAVRQDRHAVLEALAARRCYALTGPRIIVDMALEATPGQRGRRRRPARAAGHPPRLATEAMLDGVDIYRNGWRVDTIVLSGRRQELSWSAPDPPAGGDLSYFAKITRADHECAWTSPIWINRR